jgi:hypothetical protein
VKARQRPRRRPRWEGAFLAALRDSGNVRLACSRTGIARRTAYDLRDRHEDFAAAWDDALEDACDLLEAEARRRAHDGVDEPVVYQGKLCGTWIDAEGKPVTEGTEGATLIPLTVKKYSDPVLLALLRAHRPEKYRDSVQHEHKGTVRHKGKVKAEVDITAAKRREFYRGLGVLLAPYPEAKQAVGAFLQSQLQAEGGGHAQEE